MTTFFNNQGYVWLTPESQQFLDRGYLNGLTVDERVKVICNEAERRLNLPGYAERLKAVVKKGWISFSTPIWTNFGNNRGLPISCFGSNIDDTIESILFTQAEVGMMTKHGGGTSVFFGNLRERGAGIKNNGESSGAVHFMQPFNTLINVISQGDTRRGNLSAWLNIDHKDILEFLTIRTEGSPIQNLSYGVTVPDWWLEQMRAGDEDKRSVWAKVLEARSETGFPYIMFSDNANRGAADVYRDKGMKIVHSNLCTEIMEPDTFDESFVCDLLSMNILHFDAWKDTDTVEVATFLLDAVIDEFIEKASGIPFLKRAVRFATRHRALGIGWLGWHSYLQSKMIALESMEAKYHNVQVAQTIHNQAFAASAKLAEMYGEPELLKGYGRRNATLLAIAPTKSSAFILGQVSEGIEPIRSNYFIDDKAKGKYTVKNKFLEAVLEVKGKNAEDVWNSILTNAGSVQHLDFLSEHEKAVFKTFSEISQRELVIQASQRQKYIDQGQSLNLMIHPSVPTKEVNQLMFLAWELGIKSLYYQIGVNAAQEFSRSINECVSCEA